MMPFLIVKGYVPHEFTESHFPSNFSHMTGHESRFDSPLLPRWSFLRFFTPAAVLCLFRIGVDKKPDVSAGEYGICSLLIPEGLWIIYIVVDFLKASWLLREAVLIY